MLYRGVQYFIFQLGRPQQCRILQPKGKFIQSTRGPMLCLQMLEGSFTRTRTFKAHFSQGSPTQDRVSIFFDPQALNYVKFVKIIIPKSHEQPSQKRCLCKAPKPKFFRNFSMLNLVLNNIKIRVGKSGQISDYDRLHAT